MINLDDGALQSPRSNINQDDLVNKTNNESFAGDINQIMKEMGTGSTASGKQSNKIPSAEPNEKNQFDTGD